MGKQEALQVSISHECIFFRVKVLNSTIILSRHSEHKLNFQLNIKHLNIKYLQHIINCEHRFNIRGMRNKWKSVNSSMPFNGSLLQFICAPIFIYFHLLKSKNSLKFSCYILKTQINLLIREMLAFVFYCIVWLIVFLTFLGSIGLVLKRNSFGSTKGDTLKTRYFQHDKSTFA